jgi:hypothetical protein
MLNAPSTPLAAMGAFLAIVLAGCAATTTTAPASTTPIDTHHGPMGEIVGPTSQEEIEAELPAWRTAREASTIDSDAAARLASVPAGATVTVFLGTWCGDSRREVSRLFVALAAAGELPFAIAFIGVDRSKQAPGYTESADLRYVPTIVVARDGVEVGRIIESAPLGVERALLELLDGTRSGVISGRTDL